MVGGHEGQLEVAWLTFPSLLVLRLWEGVKARLMSPPVGD